MNELRICSNSCTSLLDARPLILIDHVDDRTGASVRMWANVDAAPIEWGAILKAAQVTR